MGRNSIERIIDLFLAGVFFLLETWESPMIGSYESAFLDVVFDHKIYIGVCILIIFISEKAIFSFIDVNKKEKLIKRIISIYFETYLGGDHNNNRITIYKKKGGLKVIWYFIRSTFRNFNYFIRRNCLWYRLSCFPNPLRKYLVVQMREGNPNRAKKSTFFRIPDNESELNGFTAFVYYSKKKEVTELPKINIEKFKKYNRLEDISDNQLKDDVEQYMELSKVTSFGRLKQFRRHSQFLWGNVLYVKDSSEPSHVVLLDSKNDIRKVDIAEKTLIENIQLIQEILKN